jgi:uncharacterized NAD(P)/FAD-binding protein YdhS
MVGPMNRKPQSIVIVGGGFAGAAAAFHLLERGSSHLRISLIERGSQFGRGVAYGVTSSLYRLNVPASRMSIDPRRSDDFVVWAGATSSPNAFLPRTLYGAYVEAALTKAVRESRAELCAIRGEASGIDGDSVQLSDGRRVPADVVILATGLAPRIAPRWMSSDSRIVDCWDERALVNLPTQGRVLILGSGLSALDVISTLSAREFSGQVTVLSRHGLLPRPHIDPSLRPKPISAEAIDASPKELRALLGWVRRLVNERSSEGDAWQLAIDALRPHVPHLWQRLSASDRARFVRSIRPYWDVLRHRAPNDMLDIVARWQERGALERAAGQVISCEPNDEGLDVLICERGGHLRRERFDAIVRCIGPALTQSDMDAPLLASLVTKGEAMRDPAGLGIVTTKNGAIVNVKGDASTRIFTLGALRRASEWECTAVPEIARQASALSEQLCSSSAVVQ